MKSVGARRSSGRSKHEHIPNIADGVKLRIARIAEERTMVNGRSNVVNPSAGFAKRKPAKQKPSKNAETREHAKTGAMPMLASTRPVVGKELPANRLWPW